MLRGSKSHRFKRRLCFSSVDLEIGSPPSPGDKEGPSRVVTPRFSPSPPLRSFLSINPRKSQRTEILSSVRLLHPSSFIHLSLFLLLPIMPNVSPFSFSVSLHSLYPAFLSPALVRPLFASCCLDANCCHVPLPQARTSVARCPFISSSLPPPPPLIRSLTPSPFLSQAWLLSAHTLTMTESINPPSPPPTRFNLN